MTPSQDASSSAAVPSTAQAVSAGSSVSASSVSAERRRPRSDGQRNRARLVAAAQQVFAQHGPDAPLDEIARHAGVGNATLYRHFPTRSELVVAVYAEEVAEICARGERLREAADPGDALFEWLRMFIVHVADKRDLALAVGDDHDPARATLYDQWHQAMEQTAAALLDRARQAGLVRADVGPVDLLTLANGIALSRPDPARLDRLLGILRRGVSTGSAAGIGRAASGRYQP
jgi:AcrR family transcriptional regulator